MDTLLLVGAIAFLGFTLYTNQKIKKQQQAYYDRLNELKEKYGTLDSNTFDSLDNATLRNAIVARMSLRKDNYEDFENHLTHGEKIVYTFFLVENAFKQGRGSLYDFFIGETSSKFVDTLIPCFNELGSSAGARIMEDAIALNAKYIREEEGEEVEYKDSDPTFEDFNQRYLQVRENDALQEKVEVYIREHKEEFID